jgi:hypothetical protein
MPVVLYVYKILVSQPMARIYPENIWEMGDVENDRT